MSAGGAGGALADAVAGLRDRLRATRLALPSADVEAHRRLRDELAQQVDDYVLPRLSRLDAPLLAVVGGSTGAGKSTLVNALVGRVVTRPGVLRPTTRSPVLVHHPDDAGWFADDALLPDLARVTSAGTDDAGGLGSLRLVADDGVPRGLALLDAPDIDSVERANRELATQLLAAADLWLFVTSAARYADQVPWDFLRAASERSTALAMVLDRTPSEAGEEVGQDLARLLREQGLGDARLFTVTEEPLGPDGMLPARVVEPVRAWLRDLAADGEARDAVVRGTLVGAVGSLARRSLEVVDAAAEQQVSTARLGADAEHAYLRAADAIGEACADGSLLRGEVLARWQEFVGTGELLRNLESRIGWLRDRVVDVVRGRPRGVERVSTAVESGLETLLVEHAEAAAERAADAWRGTRAGAALLREKPTLARASRSVREEAERAVRDWQRAVFDLVAAEGAEKRSTARRLAFGVNGLAVALMVVTFVHTAGMSGAEAGIAGTSAFVGQKLLEAVFGDQAVRRLAEAARRDLDERVGLLLAGEKARFDAVLSGLGDDDPQALRRAAADVEQARSAWVGA